MRRTIRFAMMACILSLPGVAQAQVNVLAEILTGGPIALDNGTATTNLGTLIPFVGEARFSQTPDLLSPSDGVNTSESERLFKHDYTFVVPPGGTVGGGATANDLPSAANVTFMGQPVLDIRQFTMALFTDGGPAGGGALVDPPGAAQVLNPGRFIELIFTDLTPGQYTLRVAGILNGFDSDLDWHGEYQGSVAITPLPGALVMFLTALAGLGFAGWRRSRTAAEA